MTRGALMVYSLTKVLYKFQQLLGISFICCLLCDR